MGRITARTQLVSTPAVPPARCNGCAGSAYDLRVPHGPRQLQHRRHGSCAGAQCPVRSVCKRACECDCTRGRAWAGARCDAGASDDLQHGVNDSPGAPRGARASSAACISPRVAMLASPPQRIAADWLSASFCSPLCSCTSSCGCLAAALASIGPVAVAGGARSPREALSGLTQAVAFVGRLWRARPLQ